MKLSVKHQAWLLPLLLLTACFHSHKTKQSQVQTLAPPIVDLQPTTIPSLPNPQPPVVALADQTPAPEIRPVEPAQKTSKPPVKHKKPVSSSTQQASNISPGVSAIGQLSFGDSSDQRQQTLDSIAATERGLNGIGRTLNEQEQKIAAHIRDFLKQARTALTSGDVDGAHTLAAKAKVLLGELSR